MPTSILQLIAIAVMLAGLSACATREPAPVPAPEPEPVTQPESEPAATEPESAAAPAIEGGEPALPDAPEVIALPEAPEPVQEALPPSPEEQRRTEAEERLEAALDARRSGDLTRAEERLEAMTEDYDEFAGPYINLGLVYLEQDRLDDAEAAFRAALERNPDQAASYNHLGVIHRRQGRFEEARAAYQEALEIDPAYANAHLNYAILLDLYRGRPDEALGHYRRYEQLAAAPDERVANWILEVKRRAGVE